MISTGIATVKFERCRWQLYWPNITMRHGKQTEVLLGLDTVARFVIDRRKSLYWGVGFQLLGFGFGFDYFAGIKSEKQS